MARRVEEKVVEEKARLHLLPDENLEAVRVHMEPPSLREGETLITRTESLCPECLRILPATVFERDGKVWIRRSCLEHGEIEEIYWGSYEFYTRMSAYAHEGKGIETPNVLEENPICPMACGLCNLHSSHTGLANVVLTNRCDLSCWYCFFYAERAGYVYEPSLKQLKKMFRALREERPVPGNAIQLTGGEPSLRDDVFEIVKMAREVGIEHVQFNTHGLRLAYEPDFARGLREAGVNTLYVSFDGVTPETNPKCHWEIPYALENCRRAGLGVVLVPTVIRNLNLHGLGDIIRFGFRNMDIIRGVNFQPVSLVGRISREEREKLRVTIPDVLEAIEEQTQGQIQVEDWYTCPSTSSVTHFVEALTGRPHYELSVHFTCGVGTYVFRDGEKMTPITRFVDIEGLFEYLQEKADELQSGANKRWVELKMLYKLRSFIDSKKTPKGFKLSRILYNILMRHSYGALGTFHYDALFLGMMHFMDLYNYDIARVKRCDIHYLSPDGRIIPFCAFNVMPELYRDKTQKRYGVSIEEWEKHTGKKISSKPYKRDIKGLEKGEIYKRAYQGFIPKA
ncbi:MAG: tetraether lipid synthase Tes [Candidatus Geothermarchaeales archaeon]